MFLVCGINHYWLHFCIFLIQKFTAFTLFIILLTVVKGAYITAMVSRNQESEKIFMVIKKWIILKNENWPKNRGFWKAETENRTDLNEKKDKLNLRKTEKNS